jgi:hypothetical protein
MPGSIALFGSGWVAHRSLSDAVDTSIALFTVTVRRSVRPCGLPARAWSMSDFCGPVIRLSAVGPNSWRSPKKNRCAQFGVLVERCTVTNSTSPAKSRRSPS